MSDIKSALVLKDKIYCPLDEDSHENMIAELKLRDDHAYRAPTFVRVEMVLIDGDIFNHKKSNWKFKVDQDNVPDWFDEVNASKEMWQYVKEWFDKRFIIDDMSNQQRKNERLYLKNSSAVLRENSSAVLWGNSSAVLRENSSKIKSLNDNAIVRDFTGDEQKIIVANPKIKLVKFKITD
jgi:hypothetical protein